MELGPGFSSCLSAGCRGRAGDAGDAEFFSSGADAAAVVRSLWRNGRARGTSNPEVPGSSPGRDDLQAGGSFLFTPTPSQVPIPHVYNPPGGFRGEDDIDLSRHPPAELMHINSRVLPS